MSIAQSIDVMPGKSLAIAASRDYSTSQEPHPHHLFRWKLFVDDSPTQLQDVEFSLVWRDPWHSGSCCAGNSAQNKASVLQDESPVQPGMFGPIQTMDDVETIRESF